MLSETNRAFSLHTACFSPSRASRVTSETKQITQRRASQMLGLEDLEIGLMFWAGPDARATLDHVKSFGLRAGQLGFPGGYSLEGAGDVWDEALRSARFTPVTVVCSYVGEDYADIPTVQRTVGLVPESTRAQRIARTKAVADVGKVLGVDSVACHIGFVPEDEHEPLYAEIRDVTRDICDHCAKNGQNF